MKPSSFPQSNMTLQPPKAVVPEEIAALPVYKDGEMYVSLWRASSWAERIRFLLHGKLWLYVLGQNHPPLVMVIENDPFTEPAAGADELDADR